MVGLAPYVLIFGGIVSVSRLLRFFIKGSAGKILKGLGYLGFFVGVLLLATGVVVLLGQALTIDVWVLLVVTGLGLALKPLGRIPFSALLGLIVGLFCAGFFICIFRYQRPC